MILRIYALMSHCFLSHLSFARACTALSYTTNGNMMTAFPPPSDRCFTSDVKRMCRRSIDSFVRSCLTVVRSFGVKGGE